jgi:acyl-CoA reductase-like NAD-dependent aldehyde dehydrogenase
VREPVGVVACITPWNFPLNQIVKKVAYALAAGCTVVVKPSEIAPFDSYVLAEVVERSGLPPGVFNLVCGTGPTAGEHLATHPDVDMISLTGSTRAGVRVASLAVATMKRLTLELGGKGASVVLEATSDDLLGKAVDHALERCLHNAGQACGSITRLIVPRQRLHDVEERIAAELATSFRVGDPFDESTEVGPLVSASQRDRVLGYIADGIRSGARLVAGGAEPPPGLPTGFYVRPTVFSDVDSSSVIAQEEIFGPVLCLIAADNDAQALEIADGTRYGLSGAVWSDDVDAAYDACRQLRVGGLTINGQGGSFETPTGGFKMSGIGREYGKYGYEEFTELKTIHIPGLAAT